MRFRSPTNSHPYRNDAVRHVYADANRYDELARLFPEWCPGWTTIPGTVATHVRAHETPATQVHHIAWAGQRWDKVWNVISLGDWSHQFCHDHKWDGVALCLKVKLDKHEWNADEARQCLGFDLVGKLHCNGCKYDFAEKIRLSVLESFCKEQS